jgi:MOSC domain-containing protein YiiM
MIALESTARSGTARTDCHVIVRRLYISPGHNFRGHHGCPPGQHPILTAQELECHAGRGIVGDRYYDYKPDYKGQITFLDEAVYRSLCEMLGVEVPRSALRRNVVLAGVDLNSLIGCDFALQGVGFQGIEECRPCYWMDHAVAPGAEDFLQDRGGLRARILTDGSIRPGVSILARSR